MSKILSFYGASDDLIEVQDSQGTDEEYSAENWVGVIEAPNGDTALVYVDLRSTGCWTVALGLYEEDYALPAWPVTTVVDSSISTFSTYMTVEVPDGTTIKQFSAEG